MGAPVNASLGQGVHASLTVLGPEQSTTRPGARSTKGTFTVVVVPTVGTLRVGASDFSSRNETGTAVHLHPSRLTSVRATATRPARLTLAGRYESGAAQVTYRHAGQLVAIWDFNIELD